MLGSKEMIMVIGISVYSSRIPKALAAFRPGKMANFKAVPICLKVAGALCSAS